MLGILMKKTALTSFIILLIIFTSCSTLRQDISGNNSVNEIIDTKIGGVSQSIIVRGHDKSNPLLLRLHGGPGYPFFIDIPTDSPLSKLEEMFTVVYWEQRGTGRSYSARIREKSMNIEQFLSDLHEVVELVTHKFKSPKVYLWGHSWGTNLGMLYAQSHPDELYAYIGTGQSVNQMENEHSLYDYLRKKATRQGDKEVLRGLRSIDTADYRVKDALEMRKWLNRYGGIVYRQRKEKLYADPSDFKKIMHTPEYSLRDKVNIFLHPLYSGRMLWDDLKKIDLETQVRKVDVPVYFFLGRHDRIVSSVIADQYFNVLEAPTKELVWFNNSAHRPHVEETEKFLRNMSRIRAMHQN